MQQYLYLARHAHAVDDAPSDEVRPLSPKGRKQLARLIKGLKNRNLIVPELIWHSGLDRAVETARILKDGLYLSPALTTMPALAPFGDPANIVESIEEIRQGSCLIVGHEPHLSRLTSLLLSGDTAFERVVFQKASVLCLSRLKSGDQTTPWQIEWHLSHLLFK